MHTIAICDDQETEISYLTNIVQSWAGARNQPIQIRNFPSAEAFLFAYEDDCDMDILLLDIQMQAMDGVTLAKKVRAGNKEVQIIFISGYMEYIADGYDVEALNFLVKPASQEKLWAVLDKATERLGRNQKSLFVQHGGENIRIPLYEIKYIEVMHNHTTIHANQEYRIKKPLAELEKELDGSFFRAGRSYIINLRYVRRSSKTEVHLADGAVVPLSRGVYAALNRAIIDFG